MSQEAPFSLEGMTEADVPMLLLPYQQRWLADESGFKLYTKSRRIGISWADAGGAALIAAQTKGRNTFYMGYEKEMARGYIQDAAQWAKLYNLAASQVEEDEIFRDGDEDKAIQVFRIWFNSGHRIEALSSNPRNMRSRQGDLMIDEAAFHDDLSEVLKAAKAMRIWGGKIRLVSTYNGVDEPYYELERNVLAGKLPYARHFTTLDDALKQGLFQRICLMSGQQWSALKEAQFRQQLMDEFGEDADEELLCIPKRSGGRYFSRVLLEGQMREDIPVIRLTLTDDFVMRSQYERETTIQDWCDDHLHEVLASLNPNLKTFYGFDFGRTGDISVLLPICEMPNLVRRSLFALEMRNVPFEQQRQVLFYVADRLPRFMAGAMDSRGNGQYLAEVAMQRYGTRIEQVKFTDAWYAEHTPKYKADLEDKKFELPQYADMLDDHRAVVVVRGTPRIEKKRGKGSDGGQRHGDAFIAALLADYASRFEVPPIEYHVAPNARPRIGYTLDDYTLGG